MTAALALAAAGAPAAAEAQGAAYGIRAGLVGKTSLPGDHFDYGLEAGTSVADSVVLSNYTDQPLTLSVYPADVRGAEGGGLAPAQAYEQMRWVGAWVRLHDGQLTLPPHGELVDAFTLAVPPGTVPGDYVGGIVASLAPRSAVDGGMGVETRVARLIRLRVPGEVHLGVTVDPPRAGTDGDGTPLTVEVHNTGNVLWRFTRADVIVRGRGGGVAARVPLSPQDIYVVPGGHATLGGTWKGAPAIGRFTARGELDVTVADEPAGVFFSPPRHFTFIPVALALRLVVVLLVLALAGVLTRKRCGRLLAYRRQERAELAEVRARLRARRSADIELTAPAAGDR